MSNFFKNDPQITWTKVRCPICNQPTGPKSECYNLIKDKNLPHHKRTMLHPQLGVLPLFSENCAFRQDNTWQADINYPASIPLIERLRVIKGLEKVYPTKTYTIHICIAKLFSEQEVKSEVTRTYNTFIKEMQALEGGNKTKKITQMPEIVGVILPNGERVIVHHDTIEDQLKQEIVFKNIVEEIPDSKPIHSEEIGSSVTNENPG